MDKKRKDKIIRLIGVYLVLFIFIVFNITNHYKFFILQNDWGYILLTIGGYLLFSSFIEKNKPSKSMFKFHCEFEKNLSEKILQANTINL
ncbi:MAG: hypothetical protein RBT59_06795 [Arcobacteraceae bacterium]|jgi:hypothetical protein|nr:hypothetical protein [Arcobacteraceae bacterium]